MLSVSKYRPALMRPSPDPLGRPVSQRPMDAKLPARAKVAAARTQDSYGVTMPGTYPPPPPRKSAQAQAMEANLGAIQVFTAALGDVVAHAEAVQEDMGRVHKQLPWLARRLGGAMGRVILPLAVGSTVVFVALALPYVALTYGAVAAFVTWYLLRDPDPPAPAGPLPPPAQEPKLRRPRLEYARLKLQNGLFRAEQEQLRAALKDCTAHHGANAAVLLNARLAHLRAQLQHKREGLKPLQEALGLSKWSVGLPTWGTAAGAATLLNAASALVESLLGPLWRGMWSLMAQPLIAVASLFYLDRGVRDFVASMSADHRACEDRLYLLQGEIEALTRIQRAYGEPDRRAHPAVAAVQHLWAKFYGAPKA